MTKAKWDDYKKTITVLTDEQIKELEIEAERVAVKLNDENENLENK
jgi:hypothetical protein